MQRMRWFLATVVTIAAVALAAGQQPPAAVTASTQPALSADGASMAFVAGGAIWTAPAAGGVAHLLVADGATDSRPYYSPDGKWLAYDTTRTGNGDIYLLELANGHLHRLSWDDGMDALDGFSPDSQWVYFTSSSHNIGGMNDVYRVRVTGGTPMIVTSERYESEYDAAAAPDGSVAFCAGGEMPLSQWWRDGEAHIDQTAIWSVNPATMKYTQLVAGGAKQIWPMFTPDGRRLYFMSDRSGAENIWLKDGAAAARPVTHFADGRVLFPSMGPRGRAIVFERDFGIWRLDLRSGKAAPVALQLEGAAGQPSITHDAVTTFQDMAVSPDGKKVAFTAHGEVFALGTEDGGDAIRLTHTGVEQSELTWTPDSRKLVYMSDRGGHYHLYEYDFAASSERQLTQGAGSEDRPVFSPAGHWLAYVENGNAWMAMDTATGATHQIAAGHFGLPPAGRGGLVFSPDSQYVAFLDSTAGRFTNAYIVAVSGGATPEQVSFLANASGGSLAWSPDAQYLLFTTGQRTQPGHIARVDLVPQLPVYREDVFHHLFDNQPSGRRGGRGSAAAAPAPAKTTILYTGISDRTSYLPMVDARNPEFSPDGKWLAYVSSASGGGRGGNIYLMSLDRDRAAADGAAAPPKQLTSTPGAKSDLQFTADSKQIYFLGAGHIEHVAVTGGAPRQVRATAALDVDWSQEKGEAFHEAWRYLRDGYQRADMNGVNWNDVRARYAPVVAGARTPADLNRVLLEMIGEMNSSHSGLSLPGRRTSTSGHIGLFFDRAKYESGGQLCVSEVVPLTPAALGGVRVGDCLTSINGQAIAANGNLDQRLADTIGQKLTLGLQRGGATATAVVQPENAAAAKHTLYLAWVEHNRELVDQLSHGALGYVHMQDMEQGSLDKLYMDLNTVNFARKGVVIDVRNNNGGFVNAYALDVLTRRPYLTMIPRRSGIKVPAREQLGEYALEKPTVLVTNQNSLSDSEDFTEGYEAMHLGKVVGVPTAGWIIYTGSARLIDGSTLRMPGTQVFDHNGKPMELHPRPVDVEAQDPPGSWRAGVDPQLAAAVRTLLAQISGAGGARATAAGPTTDH